MHKNKVEPIQVQARARAFEVDENAAEHKNNENETSGMCSL